MSYDIELLTRLLEAATPGPWYVGRVIIDGEPKPIQMNETNKELIVASVNALPSMLSDLRCLQKARELLNLYKKDER